MGIRTLGPLASDVLGRHFSTGRENTIITSYTYEYDTKPYDIFTCAQSLTKSQLNASHGTKNE